MEEAQNKIEKLQKQLRRLGSAVIAFSGGVDSTFLLKVSHEVLGISTIAATAVSESLPTGELEEAEKLASQIGVRHIAIRTYETRDERYLSNAANRCYFCKTEMYTRMLELAAREGIHYVLDGLNVDDLRDRRPGRAAAQERGVLSPLVDAGLTKAEIRAYSRELALPTWDKPALACLSSRIPFDTRITLQALTQVDRAEMYLRNLGVRQVRVRHFGDTARIEVEPSDFPLLDVHYSEIRAFLNALGFERIAIDPEGYRPGSLFPFPPSPGTPQLP